MEREGFARPRAARKGMSWRRPGLLWVLVGLAGAVTARGQQPASLVAAAPTMGFDEAAPDGNAAPARHFRLGVELEANFRDSADYKISTRYPGLSGPASFEQTVDPGSHFEISQVALLADYQPTALVQAHLRFTGVDLYYRNPTSTDRQYDLAELWLRWGRQALVATDARKLGVYAKVGKFARPERQEDRHLTSYGIAGTAFNLFEDAGVELGADLGRHFFAKASVTEGNPLFIRDPNALAGDTPDLLAGTDAALNSGLVVLYDSHVERLDFAHPEYAGYLGWRLGDAAKGNGLEVMAWGRRRTLAASEQMAGSPLGGDLAILSFPGGTPILPIHGDGKEEAGLNFWLYGQHGLSVFGQYVYQRVAGLARDAIEVEVAWKVELPLVLAAGGHQIFGWIAPAVRYSRLHDDFPNLFPTPEPNLAWDWEKYDAGVRMGLWHDVDLTLEYSYNRIYLSPQVVDNENEGLATLRIRVW